MLPLHSTFPIACTSLSAGSAPDLRCSSPSSSYGGRSQSRSPRHNARTTSVQNRSTRCCRRQRRAGSDGPVIAHRPALHSPGSPGRNRRDSMWGDDFPRTEFRRRVSTMPSRSPSSAYQYHQGLSKESEDPDYYRLRSFSVTSKGIVHLGDLLRHRSKSTASLGSEGSSSMTDTDFRDRTSSSGSNRTECANYRVLFVGSPGVGKSTLVAQSMTSNNLLPFDDVADAISEHDNEKSVSVLLDGEESVMSFLDEDGEYTQINELLLTGMDAVVVVYSVVDRESFQLAALTLETLRRLHDKHRIIGSKNQLPKAIILVGNKADLVRCKTVTSEEAKSLANRFNSKFIETSGAIGHNVNELLVGILRQIRLQNKHSFTSAWKHQGFTTKARGLMHRLLMKCEVRARSCENLHVI